MVGWNMKVIHPLTVAACLLYHRVLLFFMASIGTKEERSYFLFIISLSWGIGRLGPVLPLQSRNSFSIKGRSCQMVEPLGPVDVPPLQPVDGHFIYQTVNLQAPNASRYGPPAEIAALNSRHLCSLRHTLGVLSLPQIN